MCEKKVARFEKVNNVPPLTRGEGTMENLSFQKKEAQIDGGGNSPTILQRFGE